MCSRRPSCISFFFFNDTATTEIYTLSLHDALPISACLRVGPGRATRAETVTALRRLGTARSLSADLLAHLVQGGDMIRQFGVAAGSVALCAVGIFAGRSPTAAVARAREAPAACRPTCPQP